MEPDKVGYSMTLKVGLPNYGSADVQVSYTSSVKEGETVEQAHQRVVSFVETKLEEGKAKLESLTVAVPEPDSAHKSAGSSKGAPAGFPKSFPKAKSEAPVATSAPSGFPKKQESEPVQETAPKTNTNSLSQLKAAVSKAPVTPAVSEKVTQPAATPLAATANDSTIAEIQAKYGIKPAQASPVNLGALKR